MSEDCLASKSPRRDGAARTGEISLPRGTIRTPAFMPVGTAATVKAMYAEQVRALGSDIVLGNTYHLMLRPGAERVAALGGLHEFMQWPHPILTDSGGFQVMSLAKLRKLDENGVTFQSHIDGSTHVLTPERSMEIQRLLGADIQMQFDECVRLPCSAEEAERAMRLSLRWAERSKIAFGEQQGRALFGIVQGGADAGAARRERTCSARHGFPWLRDRRSCRRRTARRDAGDDRDGRPASAATTNPRYLMGVGTPDDIVEAVARGIDMFDCVMPTRAGRHGLAFTRFGRINLRNAKHADDPAPLDPDVIVPGRPRLFAGLSASPGQLRRNPRDDAADLEQSCLLPGADGGPARGDRDWPSQPISRGCEAGLGPK